MKSGGEKREKKDNKPYFVVFYKVHKSCPLYFHRLPLSVVESQNKVEEIGFPQVGGWLLFKVSSGQSYSAVEETHGIGCGGKRQRHYKPVQQHYEQNDERARQKGFGEKPGEVGRVQVPLQVPPRPLPPPAVPRFAAACSCAAPGGVAALRGQKKQSTGLGALNPKSWC